MGIELRPYQQEAIEAVRGLMREGKKKVLMVASVGCHAPGQEVLKYDGTTARVEDLRIGDQLVGPDGPREILRLCHGFGPMRRIVPTKGQVFDVNDQHVLSLVRTNDGSNLANQKFDIKVADFEAWPRHQRNDSKLFRSSADFEPQSVDLPLDPYFLGVLLGDGSFNRSIAVTKPDPEIIAVVKEQAALFGLNFRTETSGGTRCPSHFLAKPHKGPSPNPIALILSSLGLRKGDALVGRFVPQIYKSSSRHVRLQVLAGLMDTDGHMSGSSCYDFISAHERLSGDVVFLARSLGMAAYVSPTRKTDQNGNGGIYWRVSLSGDCSIIPCRIPRKRASFVYKKKDPLRTGLTIEPLPDGEFFGFTLTGDGRYLLDDFIVTHNSGKTIVFSAVVQSAVAKGSRSLILAHRKELIDQASEKLTRFGVPHGIIMPGYRPALQEPVQVASVQTLVRRPGALERVDLIVLDECHHYGSAQDSYGKILGRFPHARVLGVTGSPWRLDGKGLSDVFDGHAIIRTPRQLFQDGYLVPVSGWVYESVSTKDSRVRGGDFLAEDLVKSAGSRKVVGDAIWEYQRWADGKRAVLFAVNVEHSKQMAAEFRAAGVAAEHVDGETPKAERNAIFRRVREGTTKVLCNVNVVSEGFDLPELEVAIMLRPTLSVVLAIQQIGRVLRQAPGKTCARIHDHAGILAMHGHPYAERDYSPLNTVEMTRAKAEERQASASKKVCPNCQAFVDDLWPCVCGYKPEAFKVEEVAARRDIQGFEDKPVPATLKWTLEKRELAWQKRTEEQKREFYMRMLEKHGVPAKANRAYRWTSGDTEWPKLAWRVAAGEKLPPKLDFLYRSGRVA